MAIKKGTAANLRTALANDAAYTEIHEALNGLEGSGLKEFYEVVTLTNAAFTPLATKVPLGAVLVNVAARLDATVVGDGSGDNGLTKVGIGTASDPDAYGLTASLLKNQKTNTMFNAAALAAETTLRVSAVNNLGVAVTEAFVAGSKVTVRVVYMLSDALPDAP